MYPIAYEADFNPAPNRVTTFFRIILIIPWLIVAYVYLLAAFFTYIFAWLSVVILGRYPLWLYDFNSGVVRYLVRFYAFAYLQTDEFPLFGLGDDPAYPIRVNIAPASSQQSRLKAFSRPILVLPMLLVSYAVNYVHIGATIIAWLTIVFRGYLPKAINATLTFVNGFYARVFGYGAILTDDYPPIGLEASGASALALPGQPQSPPPAPTVGLKDE